MAQFKAYNSSDFMLDEDELSAFLRELDDIWARDSTPLTTPAPTSTVSSTNRLQKPRHSRRAEIQHAQQEITELELELQIVHEKLDFCRSLQATGSCYDLDRRLMAYRERARLRKRADMNVEWIQRISKLVRQQMEALPKPTLFDHRIVKIDNRAYIYGVLQACLDVRSRGQPDAVLSRYTNMSVGSELQTRRWSSFALEDGSVGVEFHESIVLPFSSTFIVDAVRRNSSLHALEISTNTQSMPRLWKAASSNEQLVVRRIVSGSERPFLLWEDACCWQSSKTCSPLSVRGSGWVFTTSVADHADELSVVHSGGFIQIFTVDGASVQPDDTLVKDIVAYRKSLQRSRVAILENVLIYCKSKRMR